MTALTGVLVGAGSSSDDSSTLMPDTRAGSAMAVVGQKFPGEVSSESKSDRLQLVIRTANGEPTTGSVAMQQVKRLGEATSAIPHVTGVSDPFDPSAPYVSADGTTAVSTISFSSMDEAQKEQACDAVLSVAGGAPGDLEVEVGGQLYGPATSPGGIGEIAGIAVVFVVLMLTFGSLLAAGANMLVALSGVAIGTFGVPAYGAISPIEPTTITLGMMLGLP